MIRMMLREKGGAMKTTVISDMMVVKGDNIMKKPVIPIVFAANDSYSIFCYTAIYSVIKNIGKKYFYHIYVFQTNISLDSCKMLESLSNENVKVECIDISNYTWDVNLKRSLHLSIETYYRLFIPLILPQYEKILYLDSDMCILSDIAELYECDIQGYAVGAVLDIPCWPLENHSDDLGGLDCRKCFNAGVLVINALKFEKDKIREKCLALLAEDYKREIRRLIFADQDALNIVLHDNFFHLNERWNYQTQYLWRTQEVFEDARKKYIEGQDYAFIIHFAGDRKPWKYPELPKSDIFWKYAREIPEFEKIIFHIVSDVRTCEGKLKCFDAFQFPYEYVPVQSRVVIYAAGMVGRAFYEQLKVSKYADVVLWIDRNWEDMGGRLHVEAVEKIANIEYDYVVIAIDSETTANKIRDNLIQMKVPESKIVWDKYRMRRNG